MKKLAMNSLVITLMVIISNSLSAQAGWIVTNYKSSSKITSGVPYYLKDVENGWHLYYKEREYGINLGWKKQPQPNIIFEKSGGGEIKTGDKVAIKVIGGDGYLKYESRRWGINLAWSKTPVYQWELRSQANTIGSAVMTDVAIGVVNNVENDFMVHCVRSGVPVVDLGWFKDCDGGYRLPGATNGLKDLPWDKIIKYSAALAVIL